MVAERDQDVHHLMGPGLSALGATVDRAVDDMRALVMHLRPHDLRSNGLAEAIRLYAETISDRDAILLEIGVQGELPTLPRTTEQEIYLVAREAIGNSVDHAKATRLGVQLSTLWLDGAGHVVLEVTDDGIGFDANRARPGHLGLTSMRARAAQIGAELTIDSSPAGTTVRLQVPMPAGGRRGND
jgi:signal transduction histidine kinase